MSLRWLSWLKKNSAAIALTRRQNHPRRFRLTLEVLEDRLAPAMTFHVNTLGDPTSVQGNLLSLRQAVTMANNNAGSTVELDVIGTYNLTQGQVAVTANMTIIGGVAGTTPGSYLVDGNRTDRVFDIQGASTVALTGITIQNGSAASNGGGVAVENSGASLTLKNAALLNNIAKLLGGGAFVAAGSALMLDHTTVIGNQSGDAGGGVSAGGDTMILNGTTFTDNQAGSDGGAINEVGANLTVANSTFTLNGGARGGAIFFQDSTANPTSKVDVSATALSNNVAADRGAAICFLAPNAAKTSTLTVENLSTLSNNASSNLGGAINVESATAGNTTVNVLGTTLTQNTGTDSGGVYCAGVKSVMIDHSTFTDNHSTSSSDAGGLVVFDQGVTAATVQISHSTFTGNIGSGGGGINVDQASSLSIDHSTISNNHGDFLGGGIVYSGNRQGTTLFLDHVLLAGNSTAGGNGGGGGGLFFAVTGGVNDQVTIQNCTVTGNLSGGPGGGIVLLDSDPTFTAKLSGDIITGNRAYDTSSGNGGGVFITANSSNATSVTSVTVTGCTFADNRSSSANLINNGGGGLYLVLTPTGANATAALNLSANTFSGNRAVADGGGLYLIVPTFASVGQTRSLTSNTFSGNTAGGDGGGIYVDSPSGSTLGVNLLNDTVTQNAAHLGGGLFSAPNNLVSLVNTLVATNTAPSPAGTTGPDVFGTFTDGGHNLIGIKDGSTGFTVSTLVGTAANPINPLLGPLQNNGGPTFTQALLPGSPAIAGGDPANHPSTDQRGFARPALGSASAIGAVESVFPLGTGANAAFVENLYETLLGRTADPGAAIFVNFLNNGGSPTALIQAIESGSEYRTREVQSLYQKYLQRSADANGLQTGLNILNNGGTIEQVAAMIIGSPEYFHLHGSNNTDFVNALYLDVLGRPADPVAVATYVQGLNNGASRATVAAAFFSSSEYLTNLVQSFYLMDLGRKASPSEFNVFVQGLQMGATDEAIQAAILGSAESFAKRS